MPSGYRDLDFTSLGRRARADRLVQRVESATVDGLVRAAISSPRPDPQLGNTLFELLVPHELKPTLLGGENVQLVVDPETAAYPWEALASDPVASADGAVESRFALRAGLLRQFSERDAREARFAIRRPTGADVLVIANPPAGEAAPDLPGALREGRLVAKILGKRRRDHPPYAVHALMWDDGLPETIGLPPADGAEAWPHIINALYRYEYRIIHVAAHGAYHPDDPSHSGILIGLDRYLTAATIDSMPVVPEMVFLNCCHSGADREDRFRHARLLRHCSPARGQCRPVTSPARGACGRGRRVGRRRRGRLELRRHVVRIPPRRRRDVRGGRDRGEASSHAHQHVGRIPVLRRPRIPTSLPRGRNGHLTTSGPTRYTSTLGTSQEVHRACESTQPRGHSRPPGMTMVRRVDVRDNLGDTSARCARRRRSAAG